MNILLIDKRVQDYETIVAAIDPAVAVGVVFDYYEDTFDTVKARIGALGLTNGTNQISVGLIQHNYKAPMFSMLASADVAPVLSVAAQDPDLTVWTQFRDFITWCKTEINAAHFDMMACALYSDPDWKYVIDTLTAQTGVTVRASTDDTGAASLGGDWFLESHTGINLKTVYFTEAIEEYRGVLFLYPRDIREYPTKGFATGSVVAWGYGASSTAPGTVSSGVVSIYSTADGTGAAFAALKTGGSVVTWGDSTNGGTTPGTVSSGVIAVYSTGSAFAALKTDGSVVAWGNSANGGTTPGNVSSSVVAVYSTGSAFAALKGDGSVVAWGSSGNGGTTPGNVSSGVIAVYSTGSAFAALKTDGSVVAWGNSGSGGTTPGTVSSGVIAVYSTGSAFAALKTDGSVVAWGDSANGGTAPGAVSSGVVAVYSNSFSFAALKTDGSVVAWGAAANGGTDPGITGGVVAIYSNDYAFAALKNDGSVVVWGPVWGGGSAPNSVTAASSGVVAVYSTGAAFAALKSDGSVVAWGSSGYGGTDPGISSGVVSIYSANAAFAALKTDGSVVAWGNTSFGGATPGTVGSGVVSIYSTNNEFAALKTTATTFDLSMSYYTNADRYNILRKRENRRRVNLTTLNNNVFTLSAARDLQVINPNIPTSSTLRIIVPTYVSSPHSITSTATIPSGAGSVIIACDEGEPVTISGTTYVNYGSYVYKRETNNTYTKLTTEQTVSGASYTMYGGDGINSSGIALFTVPIVPILSTFSVASYKTFGDASFNITTVPTSESSGAITYSSSNTAVATIDASGNFITLIGAGDVNFIATQEGNTIYASATKTSNTLTVALGTPSLSTFSVAASKAYGDASFNITTAPTSASNGAIAYTSNATGVATINASTGVITLVSAGTVTFTASQAATSQYSTATVTSNTLTVSLATPTLSSTTFSVASSKTFGDASFNITTVPTSNSDGAITYSSSNTAVATIDASGNFITLIGAGDVNFIATQAQTTQYAGATKTSNTLTVALGTTTLARTAMAETLSKTYGVDTSFNVVASSASSGAVTYTSSDSGVATVGSSTGLVTPVSAGSTTITAQQAQSAQYSAPTSITSALTVALGTPSLSTFSVAASKAYGDASFNITTAPTSASNGAIAYTSNATGVATINASTGVITLVSAGTVTFTASQAQSAQYNVPTPVTSNTLTVSKGTTALAFVSPPASKSLTDAEFAVVASSASSGAVTYTSSNPGVATVGLTTGLVALIDTGSVTITAAQASSAQYNAPTNTTCTITVGGVTDLSGTVVTTSLANKNLTGTSFVNTVLTNVSLAGATLTNANFSGATITGAVFSNANIVGATNLPAFSTTQKLQLLRNANNVAISAVQITTLLSGTEINAAITTPIPDIAGATFFVKAPAYDASGVKVVTITTTDVSNNASLYIPMNSGETVKVNGVTYTFNGTAVLDSTGTAVTFISVLGKLFRLYAGSIVGLNVVDKLNNVKIAGYGLYDVLTDILLPKS